jgi:hypothetical protein
VASWLGAAFSSRAAGTTRPTISCESADYRPRAAVDRVLALACIHDANLVMDALEE